MRVVCGISVKSNYETANYTSDATISAFYISPNKSFSALRIGGEANTNTHVMGFADPAFFALFCFLSANNFSEVMRYLPQSGRRSQVVDADFVRDLCGYRHRDAPN